MEYAYQACWRVRTSYRTTNGTVEVEGLCFADSEADVRQRPNVQRALREGCAITVEKVRDALGTKGRA